jgi:hypothetical protein
MPSASDVVAAVSRDKLGARRSHPVRVAAADQPDEIAIIETSVAQSLVYVVERMERIARWTALPTALGLWMFHERVLIEKEESAPQHSRLHDHHGSLAERTRVIPHTSIGVRQDLCL